MTPGQIADMTPYQQLKMLGLVKGSDSVIHHASQEEYEAWHRENFGGRQ